MFGYKWRLCDNTPTDNLYIDNLSTNKKQQSTDKNIALFYFYACRPVVLNDAVATNLCVANFF